jgi:hypothetical protein
MRNGQLQRRAHERVQTDGLYAVDRRDGRVELKKSPKAQLMKR